jgi:prepilin-type N-terminal cleavage/methylation domain-containing protein
MKRKNSEKGFTLIELLLVVVIIGLMLAVIVPRAWRANIDAKYGLVRQNCSELASFGQEWAENQLLAQNESISTATVDAYLTTLAIGAAAWSSSSFAWVADTATNWRAAAVVVAGRSIAPTTSTAALVAAVPEVVVEGIIPPEKVIRNPFNEVSVFQTPNFPTATPITGAIACVTQDDAPFHYYSFLFQGTDNTAITGGGTTFYAGQDETTLTGARNGIFFARVSP